VCKVYHISITREKDISHLLTIKNRTSMKKGVKEEVKGKAIPLQAWTGP
jgi:hypothetical protein